VHNGSIAKLLKSLGPVVGLAAVWLLFAVVVGGPFVSWSNQRLMLLQTAVVGTAAVGATLVIITGGIDLSVGSSIAVGAMIVARLLAAGAPGWAAALGGVASGAVCGFMIGSLVVGDIARFVATLAAVGLAVLGWRLVQHGEVGVWIGVFIALAGPLLVVAAGYAPLRRVPLSPFIVTLGMWGALRGVAKGIGGSEPIYPPSSGGLNALMLPAESGLFSILPPGVWVLLVVAALAGLVLWMTPFGRHVFAVGSNEHAARVCGIRVERTKMWVYVIAVLCAGLAAVLQFSYLTIGDPTTAGGYELKVIAAVVIGGASLSGGEGTIRGTLIGALLMTALDNGCNKVEQLDPWVQEIVTGAIIVAAVLIDRLRHGPARG